ncbi:MAG: hypothetical protein WCO56_08180 [Verrucomicrobiota bacterium]
MRRMLGKLKSMDVPVRSMRALEFFAREGDWHTVSYATEVSSLDAWEINPQCEPALRRNLPLANIRIGDSFILARQPEFTHAFDFLVFDNPLCLFGKNGELCEHFEALELVPILMKEHGVLIFNINYHPYGYDSNPEWRRRRQAYYGISDPARLDFDFAQEFYQCKIKKFGFTVQKFFIFDRHDGIMAYVTMVL